MRVYLVLSLLSNDEIDLITVLKGALIALNIEGCC